MRDMARERSRRDERGIQRAHHRKCAFSVSDRDLQEAGEAHAPINLIAFIVLAIPRIAITLFML
jgi:hypothetical protein